MLGDPTPEAIAELEAGSERVIEVLLGARAGCKLTEDEVDRAIKRFLRKAWKTRRAVTAAVNQEFGRMDVQWMASRLVSTKTDRQIYGQKWGWEER